MTKQLIISVLVIALLFFGIFLFARRDKKTSISVPQPTAMPTQPILSPTIEMSPTQTAHPDWQTFTDPTQHVSFQYPKDFGTAYIRPQTWPPQITVSSGAFSCTQTTPNPGEPTTVQKTLDGTIYCIDTMTQGAAGTIYSDYKYTFMKDTKLITLQFTIAYPQCGNYPDPQKTACMNERRTFDLNSSIDQIAQTIQ